MGFYFRKSVKAGPFRINFSKSGVGLSVGARGARVGVDSRGRQFTQISLPGTGLGYRKTGCAAALIPLILLLLWEALS
jgi:hypothetical protein